MHTSLLLPPLPHPPPPHRAFKLNSIIFVPLCPSVPSTTDSNCRTPPHPLPLLPNISKTLRFRKFLCTFLHGDPRTLIANPTGTSYTKTLGCFPVVLLFRLRLSRVGIWIFWAPSPPPPLTVFQTLILPRLSLKFSERDNVDLE